MKKSGVRKGAFLVLGLISLLFFSLAASVFFQLNRFGQLIDDLESRESVRSALGFLQVQSAVMLGLVLLFCLGFMLPALLKVFKQLSLINENARSTANSISQEAMALRLNSENVSSALSQESAALTETSACLNGMTSNLQNSGIVAKRISASCRDALSLVEGTKETVNKLVVTMKSISDGNLKLQELAEIIENVAAKTAIINDIVFKTQLLAVNASIEAARAGSAGVGFSVVASEVGKLANNSGQAALEIASLIKSTKQKVSEFLVSSSASVEEGRHVCELVADSFAQTTVSISSINEEVKNIEASVNEQTIGMQNSKTAMTEIQAASVNNLRMSEELVKNSLALELGANATKEISDTLNHFIEGESGTAGTFSPEKKVEFKSSAIIENRASHKVERAKNADSIKEKNTKALGANIQNESNTDSVVETPPDAESLDGVANGLIAKLTSKRGAA
jgi:hypothetical protein